MYFVWFPLIRSFARSRIHASARNAVVPFCTEFYQHIQYIYNFLKGNFRFPLLKCCSVTPNRNRMRMCPCKRKFVQMNCQFTWKRDQRIRNYSFESITRAMNLRCVVVPNTSSADFVLLKYKLLNYIFIHSHIIYSFKSSFDLHKVH